MVAGHLVALIASAWCRGCNVTGVRSDAFRGCEMSEEAVGLHSALLLEQSLVQTVLRDACFLCYADEGRSR